MVVSDKPNQISSDVLLDIQSARLDSTECTSDVETFQMSSSVSNKFSYKL